MFCPPTSGILYRYYVCITINPLLVRNNSFFIVSANEACNFLDTNCDNLFNVIDLNFVCLWNLLFVCFVTCICQYSFQIHQICISTQNLMLKDYLAQNWIVILMKKKCLHLSITCYIIFLISDVRYSWVL